MKVEKTAAIAEIVSSIAILVTLGYLAVQAQQTNDMLLSNSRAALIDSNLTYMSVLIDHPEVISQMGFDPAVVRPNAMFIMLMRTLEFAWLQYQNGILDEDTFDSYMAPLDALRVSPDGTNTWSVVQEQFDPGFAQFVNTRLGIEAQ